MTESNVIILQRKRKFCLRHGPYEFDENLTYIECKTCKEKISPMKVISELSLQESKWRAYAERYKAIKRDINARKKFKCDHCNKYTDVKGIKGIL